MKKYEPSAAQAAQITRAFVGVETFRPTEEQLDRKAMLGRALETCASLIARHTPPSREQSLALTKLEEAFGWAARAIRTEPHE
jgi:hypothetical protein